jgi:hypothetical protein
VYSFRVDGNRCDCNLSQANPCCPTLQLTATDFLTDSYPNLFAFVSTDRSDVLINEDRVAVGIHHHKTCWARRTLVRLAHYLHASRLQLVL